MCKHQRLIGFIPFLFVAFLLIQACGKKEEPKPAPQAPAATAPAPTASAPTAQAPQPPPAPAPQAQPPTPPPEAPAAQPAAQGTQAPQTPPPTPVLAKADGEKPGSRVEVQELKRVSGGTVMLRFTLINDTDEKLNFGNDLTQQGLNESGTVGGVHFIDPVGKKKYLVVRDSQNKCDCSGGFHGLNAKSRVNLWARFPAPPDNVEKIGVVIPRFSPLDDVPISR